MTKEEFLDRVLAKDVKEPDFEIIEFVYTWHPLISETEGKEQVAFLYNNFGIGIFWEMLPKAKEAKELETELCEALNKVDELKKKMAELKK